MHRFNLVRWTSRQVKVSAQSRKLTRKMVIQNFQIAAKGLGEYCPNKKELRIRKHRKVYRFICREDELQLIVSGRTEVVFPLAPDAKVHEFRRGITNLSQ